MDLVDTISADILGEIDWGALYRRLKVFAFRIAREMPEVFDGVSADDLVGETLSTFWADEHGLGWDPTTQDNLEEVFMRCIEEQVYGPSPEEQESRVHYGCSARTRARCRPSASGNED